MTSKVSTVKLTTYQSCDKKVSHDSPTVPIDLSHILTSHRFPKNALTALYGHNNGASIANKAITMAEKEGLAIRSFDVFIKNNKWTIQTIGLEESPKAPGLYDINVLTMNRCRKDLRAVVHGYWSDFVAQYDCDDTLRATLEEEDPIFATTTPEFIGFLHAQPEFKHLDVITYRTRTSGGIVSMATVFSHECISCVAVGFGPPAKMVSQPKF